jgi:hypothetical protein
VGVIDSDGDGVDDSADACPGTAPAEPVDGDGCSVAQHCPCDAQRSGEPWRNHGAYVKCVVNAGRDFLREGLISRAQLAALVRAAAQSRCGAKPPASPPAPRPVDDARGRRR